MDNQFKEYENIPKEMFEVAKIEGKIHDKNLETKPIGYFKDAFIRFSKNKASIVASIIVMILILFAIIGPFCFNKGYREAYKTDNDIERYKNLTPRIGLFYGSGIWDGTKIEEISDAKYYRYLGIAEETGYNPIVKDFGTVEKINFDGSKSVLHKVRSNAYYAIDCFLKTFTKEEYLALQEYQNETGNQVILPWVDYYVRGNDYTLIKDSVVRQNNMNVWYACDERGVPKLSGGKLIPGYRTYATEDLYNSIRLENDPGNVEGSTEKWIYASVGGSSESGNSYTVRINAYNYFIYKYGFEPSFAFGSDTSGYDIFSRLASGARFSLLFAVAVSAINLVIGAIYGAIEGYYGGATDMVMERISDILSSIPDMVVCVLFNLHLSGIVGPVPSLLYAFVMTGWIGMASRTRMQFYRFKNQEYVLAARTLGAKDRRIMFKHIFPNSLGTIITGSVLAIPGVIFSETSLTYLGIINLDSTTRSSVGAMLNAGQKLMSSYPHLVLFPSLFIGLLMVSFNLFGNGLRDAFNPSLRGVED